MDDFKMADGKPTGEELKTGNEEECGHAQSVKNEAVDKKVETTNEEANDVMDSEKKEDGKSADSKGKKQESLKQKDGKAQKGKSNKDKKKEKKDQKKKKKDEAKKSVNEEKKTERPSDTLPRLVDIKSEFSATNTFLVDGDSLMLSCLEDQNVRWLHGGVFLHLIYLVERKLQIFFEKKANFNIVFFKFAAPTLWRGDESLTLFREVLIIHLQQSLKLEVLTEFLSPWDERFVQYTSDNNPNLMLMCESSTNEKRKSWFKKIVKYFLGLAINVAFLDDIQVTASAIFAFYVTSSSQIRNSLKAHREERALTITAYSQSNTSFNVEPLSGWEKFEGLSDHKIECYAVYLYIKRYQKHKKEDFYVVFPKLFLMLILVKDKLPLKKRGLPTVEDCQMLTSSISEVQNFLWNALGGLRERFGMEFAFPRNLCDLWDGNFFANVLKLVGEVWENGFQFFGKEIETKYKEMFVCINSALKDAGCAEENADWPSNEKFQTMLKGLEREERKLMPEKVLSLKEDDKFSEEIHSDEKPAHTEDQKALFLKNNQAPNKRDFPTEEKEGFPDDWEERENEEEIPDNWDSASSDGDVKDEESSPNAAMVNGEYSKKHEGGKADKGRSKLVPVQSELLELYAADIQGHLDVLNPDDPLIKELVPELKEFKDLYHWHCNKFILDSEELKEIAEKQNEEEEGGERAEKEEERDILKPLTKKERSKMTIDEIKAFEKDQRWARKRQDRKASQLTRYMEIYGSSLGENVHCDPIVVQKEQKGKKSHVHALKGHHKKSHAAEQIIAANIQTKNDEARQQAEKNVIETIKEVDQLSKDAKYRAGIELIQSKEKCFTTEESQKKIRLKMLDIYELQLKHDCQHDEKARQKVTIEMFLLVRRLHTKYVSILNEEDRMKLSASLSGLGFAALAERLFNGQPSEEADENHIEFQLKNIGHLLPRNVRTDPDPRIKGFFPDTWQRQLFDAIDANQSALIVAPTSSGKTFASYYSMEKILRKNNDDIVVYVSPTKALVNQVQAYIYKKFDKPNMPNGKVVCGTFTRDYRNNVMNCQILVTVPQCLEILLLSADSFSWSKNIKYVIFDEIHFIGSEEGAEVWEHLLCLITCPFLALSATVANPDDLHKWLQSAQNFQKENKTMYYQERSDESYVVQMVVVSDRHSDLENHVFTPDESLEMKSSPEALHRMHPYVTLKSGLNKKREIPSHLTMSPQECLILYKTMLEEWPDCQELIQLDPSVFFQGEMFLTRDDVRRYEAALKTEFQNWIIRNMVKAERVLEKLYLGISDHDVTQSDVYKHFVSLVKTIESCDMLPVIVFCLERAACEYLTYLVVEYFKEKEAIFFANKKEKKLTNFEKQVAKKERDKQTDEEQSVRKNRFEDEKNLWFDHEFCPQGGSFRGKGVADKEDLEFLYRRIVGKMSRTSFFMSFMEGIRYGISYHHSGMNNAMRSTVEILFRKKFINIVCATSTLAVGIHVPCRSVVIASHNQYLNTLVFRQMAGRSGRRGFDMVGNVIFHAVPNRKISKLVSGDLPYLLGNYPLSVTLCLRLLTVVEEVRENGKQTAKCRSDTIARALNLLKNPLILQHIPHLDVQFKHFFLFSTQFLVRERLLKLNGKPQGLAGLAAHLFYHEPCNYAFIACIQNETFHKFCNQGRRDVNGIFDEDFLRNLVLVLSHFFARKQLHESHLKYRNKSIVQLQELPPKFAESIRLYNERVEEVYDMYLHATSSYMEKVFGEDHTLPLSLVQFPTMKDVSIPSNGNNIQDKLFSLASDNKCCSSFAALSGHTDQQKVYNYTDKTTNVRHQIYTDVHEIPIMNTEDVLNSYALDFFKHGDPDAIQEENHLKSGEDYDSLKDFMLTIKLEEASRNRGRSKMIVIPERDVISSFV